LCNPVEARWRARISSIKRRVWGNKKHKGETLLREFLNALVALDDGQIDATPDFLVNPYTRELTMNRPISPPWRRRSSRSGAMP
ncbi:MAG TPA: hypothetical protein VNT01_00870, partial [Symbiobacteriaceae bacterium]|nr:hypothetical protein [Symbiobacteriaceae bacterium]